MSALRSFKRGMTDYHEVKNNHILMGRNEAKRRREIEQQAQKEREKKLKMDETVVTNIEKKNASRAKKKAADVPAPKTKRVRKKV